MTYAMSDIHGCFDLYLEMLEKIKFSDEDQLYIIGDFADRGPDGIKVFQDAMKRKNVIPLLGNHELFAIDAFEDYLCGKVPELEPWLANGGAPTMKAFLELSEQEERELLEYIESFEGPLEVKAGEYTYILSHTAPGPEEAEYFAAWDEDSFTWSREIQYSAVYYPDKFLVTGHTPTEYIEKGHLGKILKRNRHIAIDCSACVHENGGRLGCICLETQDEFYV